MSQILSFFGIKEKKQSFEAIIAPYMNNLYKIAYQYTGTKHDAEDLLQDLLEYLFEQQKALHNIEKLKPWLIKCLHNRYIDLYRKNQRQPILEDIDGDNVQPLFLHFDNHLKDEHSKEIFKAMNKLSADQRAVVTLHDINGYTLTDLSQIMDMPLGTLKSNLHRARATLKKHITLQPNDLNIRHY